MASRHGRWDSTDSNCPTVRSSSSKDGNLGISWNIWGIFPWEMWENVMAIALKIIETWNAKPHETSDMSDFFLWPDLFRYRVVLIHIRPTTNPRPHCWHTSLPKRSASRWRSNSWVMMVVSGASEKGMEGMDGRGWRRPWERYIYILSDMDKVKYGNRFSKTWSNS